MKEWQFNLLNLVLGAVLFLSVPVAFFVGVAMASSKPTPPGKFGSSSCGEGYSEGLDGVPPSVIRWTLDADYRLGRMAGQREGRQATE